MPFVTITKNIHKNFFLDVTEGEEGWTVKRFELTPAEVNDVLGLCGFTHQFNELDEKSVSFEPTRNQCNKVIDYVKGKLFACIV